MFHIDGEQLVKTSNGQPVPEDEPVFIIRARDKNAVETLTHYIWLCRMSSTPEDRIADLYEVVDRFKSYANTHQTKTPGWSHGQ